MGCVAIGSENKDELQLALVSLPLRKHIARRSPTTRANPLFGQLADAKTANDLIFTLNVSNSRRAENIATDKRKLRAFLSFPRGFLN